MENKLLDEEMLKAIDDNLDLNLNEQLSRRSRKRSSILKPPKGSEDPELAEELATRKSFGQKRRVSFADKFQVMELCTGNIYDVLGKNGSESSLNENVHSEIKSEASVMIEKTNVISCEVTVTCQATSPSRPSLKHKLVSDPESEPKEKKPSQWIAQEAFCKESLDRSRWSAADAYEAMSKRREEENAEFSFFGTLSSDLNPVGFGKADDYLQSTAGRHAQDSQPLAVADSSVFLEDELCLKKNDESKQVVSIYQATVDLSASSLSALPLQENKENIYIDSMNKSVLIAKNKDIILKEKDPPAVHGFPRESTKDPAMPLNSETKGSEIGFQTYDGEVEPDSLLLEEDLASNKTLHLNQTMNLTFLEPELEENSEACILEGAGKSFVPGKSSILAYNKTLHLDQTMNLTLIEPEPEAENSEACNLEEVGRSVVPGESSILAYNKTLPLNQTMNLTLLEPEPKPKTIEVGILNAPDESVFLSESFDPPNLLSGSVVNKTKVVNEEMELTCIGISPKSNTSVAGPEIMKAARRTSKFQIDANDSKDDSVNQCQLSPVKSEFQLSKVETPDFSFVKHTDSHEAVRKDSPVFQVVDKENYFGGRLKKNSSLCRDEFLPADENSDYLIAEPVRNENLTENTSQMLTSTRNVSDCLNISTGKSEALKTQYFTSDDMELTCKPNVAISKSKKSLDFRKQLLKTQHFRSEDMSLTCKSSNVVCSESSKGHELDPDNEFLKTKHFTCDEMEFTCKSNFPVVENKNELTSKNLDIIEKKNLFPVTTTELAKDPAMCPNAEAKELRNLTEVDVRVEPASPIQEEVPASNKTLHLNQTMNFTYLSPSAEDDRSKLGELGRVDESYLHSKSFVLPEALSENGMNKTKLVTDEMELTCVGSPPLLNMSGYPLSGLAGKDIQNVLQIKELQEPSEDVIKDTFKSAHSETQCFSVAETNVTCKSNVGHTKSEESHLDLSKQLSKTKHFTSDDMDLTCKSIVSNFKLKENQKQNLNWQEPKTQHFFSENMSLTCKSVVNSSKSKECHEQDSEKQFPKAQHFILGDHDLAFESTNVVHSDSVESHVESSNNEISRTNYLTGAEQDLACQSKFASSESESHRLDLNPRNLKENIAPIIERPLLQDPPFFKSPDVKEKQSHFPSTNLASAEKDGSICSSQEPAPKQLSHKSGILYVIKKLKAISKDGASGDSSLYPEIYSSLTKKPRSPSSLPGAKVEPSGEVKTALRNNPGFSRDVHELSFVAEVETRNTTLADQSVQKVVRQKISLHSTLQSISCPDTQPCNVEDREKKNACELSHQENLLLESDSILCSDLTINSDWMKDNSVASKSLTLPSLINSHISCLKDTVEQILPKSQLPTEARSQLVAEQVHSGIEPVDKCLGLPPTLQNFEDKGCCGPSQVSSEMSGDASHALKCSESAVLSSNPPPHFLNTTSDVGRSPFFSFEKEMPKISGVPSVHVPSSIDKSMEIPSHPCEASTEKGEQNQPVCGGPAKDSTICYSIVKPSAINTLDKSISEMQLSQESDEVFLSMECMKPVESGEASKTAVPCENLVLSETSLEMPCMNKKPSSENAAQNPPVSVLPPEIPTNCYSTSAFNLSEKITFNEDSNDEVLEVLVKDNSSFEKSENNRKLSILDDASLVKKESAESKYSQMAVLTKVVELAPIESVQPSEIQLKPVLDTAGENKSITAETSCSPIEYEIIETVSPEEYEKYVKLERLRDKLTEATKNMLMVLDLKKMDDKYAVFDLMTKNSLGCFSISVPLLFEPSGSPDVTVKSLAFDLEDCKKLSVLYFKYLNSCVFRSSPDNPDEFLAEVLSYIDTAKIVRKLMRDVRKLHVWHPLSIDFDSRFPRLKSKFVLGDVNGGPFSIFYLILPINFKTYPNEKIEAAIEHLDFNEIEESYIFEAVKNVEPGENILSRIGKAVKNVNIRVKQ